MYRVVQFYQALTAHVDPDELEAVAPLLGPRGAALFQRLSHHDQRHSLNVYATLRSWGYDQPALLTAALLHDVGKVTGRIALPCRILVTLLRRFSPRLLGYLERHGDIGLLRPFRIAGAHADIGSRLVGEAGFPEEVVELVRCHHGVPLDERWADELGEALSVLHRADGRN